MKKLVYILICSLILCQVASANKDYIGNTLKILDNLTPEEEFSIGKMQISELVTKLLLIQMVRIGRMKKDQKEA